MKKSLLNIILIIILIGCSEEKSGHSVNIRLSNISNYDFKNIVVDTSTGMVSFDDLKAGTISEYKTFAKAYRYAYIELNVEGKKYALQPNDYVGETPLAEGNYTYELNFNSQNQYNSLTISLVNE